MKGVLEQESAQDTNTCACCVRQHIQPAGITPGIKKLKDLNAEGEYETDCNRSGNLDSSPTRRRQAQESEQS